MVPGNKGKRFAPLRAVTCSLPILMNRRFVEWFCMLRSVFKLNKTNLISDFVCVETLSSYFVNWNRHYSSIEFCKLDLSLWCFHLFLKTMSNRTNPVYILQVEYCGIFYKTKTGNILVTDRHADVTKTAWDLNLQHPLEPLIFDESCCKHLPEYYFNYLCTLRDWLHVMDERSDSNRQAGRSWSEQKFEATLLG